MRAVSWHNTIHYILKMKILVQAHAHKVLVVAPPLDTCVSLLK